ASDLTGIRIDPTRLEPGDYLLRWGDAGALRYCHHATDTEATDLAASLPLTPHATWRADGDLNRYHLLRQPDSF
ncbi:MAG: class I SAM-dependent methyltransferase, partial [Thermoanaerobaculia bacterium]|nr:class I SAM-dependent methyltransferase [Thermoanaerobaculia bacterium]